MREEINFTVTNEEIKRREAKRVVINRVIERIRESLIARVVVEYYSVILFGGYLTILWYVLEHTNGWCF
ncbi:MAG: hypothetical protein WC998_06335 [Candidatus Paceibacterota bacterium]|jgi:hypothetical protein